MPTTMLQSTVDVIVPLIISQTGREHVLQHFSRVMTPLNLKLSDFEHIEDTGRTDDNKLTIGGLSTSARCNYLDILLIIYCIFIS